MEWKISETNIGRKSHAKTQRRKGKSEYEAVLRVLLIVLVLVVLALDRLTPLMGLRTDAQLRRSEIFIAGGAKRGPAP
jgi:hypothetical protein